MRHSNLLRSGFSWSELRLKLTTMTRDGLSVLPSELQIITKSLLEIPGPASQKAVTGTMDKMGEPRSARN